MLFIVMYHFFIHGVMHQHTNPDQGFFITIDSSLTEKINFFLSQMLMVIVSTGVNLFVMISGYLLIQKKELRAKSLIRLWFKVMLYALLIAVIFYSIGGCGKKNILESFFPLTTNQYWFMSPYFGLMLLAPYIARLICNLTQKQYLLLLVSLFVINFYLPFGITLSGGGSLLWFIFLFCAAGYLRMYPIMIKRQNTYIILSVLVVTAIFVLYPILKAFTNDFAIDGADVFYLKEPKYNGLCFFVSAFFFNGFLNIKCNLSRGERFISTVSISTIGVYLLHDHRLIRNLIWEKIYDYSLLSSSYRLWMVMMLICFSIFAVAIVVDILVELLLKYIKPEDFVYEKLYIRIKKRFYEFKI